MNTFVLVEPLVGMGNVEFVIMRLLQQRQWVIHYCQNSIEIF